MLGLADCKSLPLASESIDMIFTDPPYPKQFLSYYENLAREAIRVLKPGAFVFAEAGNLYLNQIYRVFDDVGLTYFYNFFHKTGNMQGMPVWVNRGVKSAIRIPSSIKHFICYSKGPSRPPVGQIFSFYETGANAKDKRFHNWGQDVGSATYYIGCFSKENDLVLDPFIGGGTTSVACELINRRWIGFDIDPIAIEISRQRLAGAHVPKVAPLFEWGNLISHSLD